MKALGVAAFALSITISIAASYTQYFYTTENVPTADIICDEEVSRSSSELSCAAKCAEQRCYRYRWNDGMCSVRKTNTSRPSGQQIFYYKKVCLFI